MTDALSKPKLAGLAADLAAFDKLEPAIHSKVRLGIVSVLAAHESLTFVEVRDALRLTDGNLAAHLRALDAAGFVRSRKVGGAGSPRSEHGKPVTEISLTGAGRNSFARYLEGLEHIVKRHR